MPQNKEDNLLEHDYDGIQELDNRLPPWWVSLYLITIAIAVVYVFVYHVAKIMPLQEAEYQAELVEAQQKYAAYADAQDSDEIPSATPGAADLKNGASLFATSCSTCHSSQGIGIEGLGSNLTLTDSPSSADFATTYASLLNTDVHLNYTKLYDTQELAQLASYVQTLRGAKIVVTKKKKAETYFSDTTNLTAGSALYKKNCAACHRADGGGLVGPSLADTSWIHGGSYKDITHSITKGIPAKGMVAWGRTLSKTEIRQVTSYIKNILQKSSPASPKKPEGPVYKGD